jgi:hypothetical protein
MRTVATIPAAAKQVKDDCLRPPDRSCRAMIRVLADASAGRDDAFCFGIEHREDGRIIADVISAVVAI